jgi:hypothetical protein
MENKRRMKIPLAGADLSLQAVNGCDALGSMKAAAAVRKKLPVAERQRPVFSGAKPFIAMVTLLLGRQRLRPRDS